MTIIVFRIFPPTPYSPTWRKIIFKDWPHYHYSKRMRRSAFLGLKTNLQIYHWGSGPTTLLLGQCTMYFQVGLTSKQGFQPQRLFIRTLCRSGVRYHRPGPSRSSFAKWCLQSQKHEQCRCEHFHWGLFYPACISRWCPDKRSRPYSFQRVS